MSGSFDVRTAGSIQSWIASGQPYAWVEARGGQWNHDDWLTLLQALQTSPYGPLEPDAVGMVLEDLKRQRANLQRWWDSGEPRRWVEARQGAWGHTDWLALIETLQQSEYGPLQPQAVGRMLEEIKSQYWTLRRWEASGEAQQWVEAHQGVWDHADWLALVETLRGSEYATVDLYAVGELLERLKAQRANLRRWSDSGEPRRWVEARGGSWDHGDWLALVDGLEHSEYGPLQAEAVGTMLEGLKAEQSQPQANPSSSQPESEIAVPQYPWSQADCLCLLDALAPSLGLEEDFPATLFIRAA